MNLKGSGFADRLSRFGIVALALSSFLVGCSSDLSQPEEGVLRVWVTWGDEPEPLQDLFDQYVQQSDQAVRVATGITEQQIQEAFEAGIPPEVLIISSADLVGELYAQGWIHPLGQQISATTIDLNDFFQAPLNQCQTEDGELVCLPWGADLLALYWNKDHFHDAGLDPDLPPQSMVELLEYAQQLTQRNNMGQIVQIGYVPDFPRSYLYLYMTTLGGAWDPDHPGILLNQEAMVEALQWERQFYQYYGSQAVEQTITSFTPFWDSNHASFAERAASCLECHRTSPLEGRIPSTGFYDGHVSMILAGVGELGPLGIDQFHPDLNYAVGSFPTSEISPSDANPTLVQGPVVVLPIGSADPEAALSLLEWMMSPEVAADFAYTTSLLPISQTAAQDPRFHQKAEYEWFLSWLENISGTPFPILPNQQDFNRILSQYEAQFLRQGGDAETLVDEISSQLEASQSP